MSRKAVLSAVVAVVTGTTLMFTGPAFATAKPTPAPTATAVLSRAARIKLKREVLEREQLQRKLALIVKAKEAAVSKPVPVKPYFTG